MLDRRTMLFTGLCLLVGCLLGLFSGLLGGKLLTKGNAENTSEVESPIRSVTITIDESQQEELFDQLRKFADKWRYAIRIAPTDQFGQDFLIQMWREDIKVIGVYPSDPGELKIWFYYTNPASPVPERFFDEEISDLKSFISEIPGATLTVK